MVVRKDIKKPLKKAESEGIRDVWGQLPKNTKKSSSKKVAPKIKPVVKQQSITWTEVDASVMAISVEESDDAILASFFKMKENEEYVLNQFWFSEINRVRKENGWSVVSNTSDHRFSRRGWKMLLNGQEIFDFNGKKNLILAFTLALAFPLTFTLAFPLTFSLAFTFALALQNNGLEKLNGAPTCEGKIVEIDGKKYKLTVV